MFSIMLGTELEPQQQFDTSNKLIKSLKQHNFIPDLVNGRKALPDEETLLLASCNYETNTKWGQEIGFLYGTVCEDVHTGFMLNCNGRNSVFCDPAKPQFLRNSTTNLNELLIQGTRWDSGLLDIG
ncbi:cellulose synthase-like protein G2 [Arachis ipaensis]|uniref:cellulose synthase-like protein G2 n=1 Tax=Arachis ipaensis TaxID=130454 RepID=UPI000A2B4090|nr:cellulose synthase-like protein G2 [Arachis ipaensis]XP_025683511.1 cellulose synthase-like protein G2 [Arachis hypogaea]